MVFPILGANTESAAYEISNSLRFNDGDSPNVSNNPNAGSGSDGSRTQFSISMWVKRSSLGLGDNNKQQFLTSAVATNNFYGTIKFGGNVAIAINQPKAARAVANACAKNPYAPKIPCHRVIRSDGALGGYSGRGGVKKKVSLLRSEKVQI